MGSGNELHEREYVNGCPNCETQFIGVTPDEFREEHAPKCNPILKLLRFTGGNQ